MKTFQNAVFFISRAAAVLAGVIIVYMVCHILLEIFVRSAFSTSTFALDELMGEIPVDVKFVCAFGGLVPVLDSRGKPTYNEDGGPELRSAYPMIPVNVLEPIIEVILTSRLHSEEI